MILPLCSFCSTISGLGMAGFSITEVFVLNKTLCVVLIASCLASSKIGREVVIAEPARFPITHHL